jgi:signal recognition particle receptor subunit beta
VQVKQGEFVTVIAEGMINTWPEKGKEYLRGPKAALLFRLGNKEFARWYGGPELIEAPEDGAIYLGYVSSQMYFSGAPIRPEYYRDDMGAYHADIIVWKTKDPSLVAKFLEESSQANPEDKTLAVVAQEFKSWQEKAKEAERIQRGLKALKELEDLKKKLSEPILVIAYPKDGITIDSEVISLAGVAEHEKGISKFDILLNDKAISLKDERNIRLVPKGQKRIEFSEKIRLREGENKIAILVQSEDGATNQKILSVRSAKKREEVYAVVVGINKYKSFPALKYAANDAREFYRYLTEVNQVPKDHVWLLLDEEATLEKLRTTLGTLLRRNAGKDDTVIIFLAGHGATEQDVSSPDGDGLEKYILPSNADPKDLYATAMPMSEIARIFQRINSERLVFIGDTCYSGASGGRTIPYPGMRANISNAFLERISQGKGRVILTASDANELSMERDDMKHGVFTYYLLEGLHGKADLDGDGVVTLDEVYRYVSTKVPQATGQGQHPARKGEVTGQIVLGVVR